jgi:hypothetical protein
MLAATVEIVANDRLRSLSRPARDLRRILRKKAGRSRQAEVSRTAVVIEAAGGGTGAGVAIGLAARSALRRRIKAKKPAAWAGTICREPLRARL